MNLKSSVLQLFLSNALNRNEPITVRANRIRDCARGLGHHTTDKYFKEVCDNIVADPIDAAVVFILEKFEAKNLH